MIYNYNNIQSHVIKFLFTTIPILPRSLLKPFSRRVNYAIYRLDDQNNKLSLDSGCLIELTSMYLIKAEVWSWYVSAYFKKRNVKLFILNKGF